MMGRVPAALAVAPSAPQTCTVMNRLAPRIMSLVLAAPASAAELTVLAGRGVLRHTDGFAWQASVGWPDYPLRVHFTVWEDNQALTVAYDVAGRRFNLALGGGWIKRTTSDLDVTNHENVYIEIGYRIVRRFRCQYVHYSSFEDDNGENLLLCGLRFGV